MIEHLRGRDRKLEPLGWTGPDAEWIALVCLHSGVFIRGQFCDYFGAGRPQAFRFVRSLIQRREAVDVRGNGALYSIPSNLQMDFTEICDEKGAIETLIRGSGLNRHIHCRWP